MTFDFQFQAMIFIEENLLFDKKTFNLQKIISNVNTVSLDEVKREIRNKNAKWEVLEPAPAAELESIDIQNRLGLQVDEEELTRLRTTESTIDLDRLITEFGRSSQRLTAPVSTVDWRSYNGLNAMTSIKNQANCGSCVAFGVAATVESMALIEHKKQYDLSEAELFFCAGPQTGAGACPKGGWYPPKAMPYLHNTGLGQEDCFPYSDQQIPCQTCQDRDQQAVYITENIEIMNKDDRKKYISSIGPVIGGMWVFSDLVYYRKGIYSHVTGRKEGGHCIEVIGFDDTQSCWICKNSWGSRWGDNGFFKIAYDEPDCGIDTQFPFWGVMGIKNSR